jgi:hypothetical protein
VEGSLRRIPLSYRSHVTGSQSLSTGVTQHESALERDYVTLTSFGDPGAVITAQPFTLNFLDGGKRRRYTPDYRVQSSDGHVEIVEVKYRCDLKDQWSRLRLAFAAARDWCGENQAIFRIATERSIRVPQLDAAKRLLPLRNAPMDAGLAAATLVTAASRTFTFAELVDHIPETRDVALGLVWCLIARGALLVELDKPIIASSPVRAA